MKLSCKSCLAKLFLKLLYATVVQKLSLGYISEAFAWSCPAKVALQSYFLSFCMDCHAEVAFQSYSSSFCMKVLCKSCLLKLFLQLLYGTVVQKLPCVKYYQYLQAPETCFWVMAKILGAGWVMLGAIKSDCSWFMILHGTVVHRWLCETMS